jgi:hypothetical protein
VAEISNRLLLRNITAHAAVRGHVVSEQERTWHATWALMDPAARARVTAEGGGAGGLPERLPTEEETALAQRDDDVDRLAAALSALQSTAEADALNLRRSLPEATLEDAAAVTTPAEVTVHIDDTLVQPTPAQDEDGAEAEAAGDHFVSFLERHRRAFPSES